MRFDLNDYVQRFPLVCKEKFGRTYDFAAIEKRFASHRDGKHILSAKDVVYLFDPAVSPFGNYWPHPPKKVLEETLSRERIKFPETPANPADVINRLLGVFHNLGSASLILQFIYPERFAIFSTPLIHLLQVMRPALVEMYIAYCDELLVWGKHFGLPSVAATSTALWTYSELAKSTADDAVSAEPRRQFEEDVWVQRRRAAQVVRPFLRRYGKLQLAHILVEEDPSIAGKIAAEEYEFYINIASRRMYGRPLRREKGAAGQLLADMAARNVIDSAFVPELQLVWELRNVVVHPHTRQITPEEVERMIDIVERVCKPWAASTARFAAAASK
jgi:hypothetical protein